MRINNSLFTVATILSFVACLVSTRVAAQQSGVTRTEHLHKDLSAPGREVIQVTVELDEGVFFGMHTHPGEEIIYVLKGTFVYEIEGQAPVTLKEGGTLFIPAGKKHSARNVGTGKASELATYIVEKGKPLLTLSNDK